MVNGLYRDYVFHFVLIYSIREFWCIYQTTETALKGGKVGFLVLTSLGFIETYESGVVESAELETQMTSVERIIEYSELTSEPALESDVKRTLPSNWPQHGSIEFKSLNLRYDENGPRSLRNLTFCIDAKVQLKALVCFSIFK